MDFFGSLSANSIVMRALDPRIHQSSQEGILKRWIAGSSTAMTSCKSGEHA
jgi:hypothetical protein